MPADRALDPFLAAADSALRALLAPLQPRRPVPGDPAATAELTDAERQESARLMRVNHAGEISAQALYHGGSLFARDPGIREILQRAAREEADHLAWCSVRLTELGARPSLLSPFWYAGSFAIGALAGLAGDRASLGFVAETERQVEKHLEDHLERLPQADERSRAIVQAMRKDEIGHGSNARVAGGLDLPSPIRELMRRAARAMTETAGRF